MDESPVVNRRHFLAGAAGAAAVAGIAAAPFVAASSASAEIPPGTDQDGGVLSPAVAGGGSTTHTALDIANPVVAAISSIDFHPINSATGYEYVSPGGVHVPGGGTGGFFNADVRLPVGATITGVALHVNPNGTATTFTLTRYRPLDPIFEELAKGTSSTGTVVERVEGVPAATDPPGLPHVIEAGWTYRFSNLNLLAAGATVFGGEVTYTVPEDPTPVGLFVPFTGANPRVYDSRSGAKFQAGEERVIALGVPGTVQSALFNLTATQTEGGGYLSCFRADVVWPGNSSVNWTQAGTDIANGVVCTVDASGQIRVRCGTGATHVIIDLLGTYA